MAKRICAVALLAVCAAVAGLSLGRAQAEKPADLKKVAAEIDGYRWEFPCKDPMPETPKEGADCVSGLVKGDPNKTDNFSAEKTFGGEKGKKYKVTLRFRGVVEPMMYKNGTKDGDYFYVGGEPDNGTYNIYKISISSPKAQLLPEPPGQGRPQDLHHRLHQDHRHRRRRNGLVAGGWAERPTDFELQEARRGRPEACPEALQRPVRADGCR